MKKIVVVSISIIILLVIGIFIFSDSKRKEYTIDKKENKKENKKEKVVKEADMYEVVEEEQFEEPGPGTEPIKDVREKIENDIKEAREGKYKNLTFSEFDIEFPKKDKIYRIDCDWDESWKKEDVKESFEKAINTYKEFYGEDIDYSKIKYHTTKNKLEIGTRYSEQFIKDIEAGVYKDYALRAVTYCNHYGEGEYCILSPYQRLFIFETKKLAHKYGYQLDKRIAVPNIEYILQNKEHVLYYTNMGKSLEDSYKLLDGSTVGVKEAVKYMNKYIKNFSYYKDNGYEIKINRIIALKIDEDKYEYILSGERYFDDMNLTSIPNGTTSEEIVTTLTGKEEIEYFNSGDTYYFEIVKNGNAIGSVISLDKAISTLSEQLGEETELNVDNIYFSYKTKPYDVSAPRKALGYPVWYFITYNKNDDKKIYFYINALTGDIETSTVLKY